MAKRKPDPAKHLISIPDLAEVLGGSSRTIYSQRSRLGDRISSGKAIKLGAYFAVLFEKRHTSRSSAEQYQRQMERQRERLNALRRLGRELGDFKREPANKRRRNRAEKSFRYFCEQYLAERFSLRWSRDHRRAIDKIEDAVDRGELFAFAMPRGSGKSSLCEAAAIWASVFGKRRFVVLIGSDAGHAEESLSTIRTELEENPALREDFPEVVEPIRALEGINLRARGQLFRGQRTRVIWDKTTVVLPTIANSAAGGVRIEARGLTGRIRGMKVGNIRPDLVVIDDPQTDESAKSPSQCEAREAIMRGAILGLAGPKKRIAGVCPLTVISPGDLADRLLDQKLAPEWQGERARMVYKWPARDDLWRTYVATWKTDRGEATAFYKANRREMDRGAVVGWRDRVRPGELSAIQTAYNLRLEVGERAFSSEYQNEPLGERRQSDELAGLDSRFVASRTNGLKRRQFPSGVETVIAGVDVQESALFWVLVGFTADFSAFVADYGIWPDPRESYVTLRKLRRTLTTETPSVGFEQALRAGLDQVDAVIGERFIRDDEVEVQRRALLIDANWSDSTETVYSFAAARGPTVIPSHGRFVGASSTPFDDWRKRPGELRGQRWRFGKLRDDFPGVRGLRFDANFWKSFVESRLRTDFPRAGALTFFDGDHRLIADHFCAEQRIRVRARGNIVDEWKPKAAQHDNHFFDAAIMSFVAASAAGCKLSGTEPAVSDQTKVAARPLFQTMKL